jgi:uncharacterized protein with HEPN domain
MAPDDLLLINIVEHARHVRDATSRLTREAYDRDIVLRMGMAHLLQVIGEAARLLPDAARQRFPSVPWNLIVGMRHRIVHEYFRIDFDVVWDTANMSVPMLLAALEPEIGPLIRARQPDIEPS